MTIDEFYKDFVLRLKKNYEEREAVNIADWVFESEGIKRSDRITNKQKQLNNFTIEQLENKLLQLIRNKPVQYVLHEAWFYKMKFFVDENVLIPRPETEELIEWIVSDLRSTKYDVRSSSSINIEHQTSDIKHILDIGTGSGCIAIALKKELPDAEIYAIDISENALSVAKQNSNNLNTQIDFLLLNILDETQWQQLSSFDIIVSNPPYIPENEKNKLRKNVVDFEPNIALFVPENDPFIFYKKIAAFALSHLKQQGKIFVEVHEDYSEEVKKIFEEKNFKTEIKKDMYGKERMIKAYK